MNLSDLLPGQRQALIAASTGKLTRVAGGYAHSKTSPVHTIRAVKQIERAGLVRYTNDFESEVVITPSGAKLLDEAAAAEPRLSA